MKNKLSGILLVNKPCGPTSHDIVDQVRKIFGTREVGHTGTLDPIASGLLILMVGAANKLSSYLMDGKKGYKVQVRLGLTTDTLDRSGQILSEKPEAIGNLTRVQIEEILQQLQGDLILPVPAFSAVKVDGKKLYQMARKNEEVPSIERRMKFFDLKILDQTQDTLTVSFRCSKGAYVRSWVQALGQKLGCGAIVQELERTFNAPYELMQSVQLKNQTIESLMGTSAWIPFDEILPQWPRVLATSVEAQRIQNGQLSPVLAIKAQKAMESRAQNAFIVSEETSQILCFVESQNNEFPRLKKVFSPCQP